MCLIENNSTLLTSIKLEQFNDLKNEIDEIFKSVTKYYKKYYLGKVGPSFLGYPEVKINGLLQEIVPITHDLIQSIIGTPFLKKAAREAYKYSQLISIFKSRMESLECSAEHISIFDIRRDLD